jgi:hypothetical protein
MTERAERAEREDNGGGGRFPSGFADTHGLPIWVRVIAVLGFPTFVACVLLAVILGWVRSPLTEVMSLQQQQIVLMTQSIQNTNEFRSEEKRMIENQNILLRTLCYSFAKDTMQCEPDRWRQERK